MKHYETLQNTTKQNQTEQHKSTWWGEGGGRTKQDIAGQHTKLWIVYRFGQFLKNTVVDDYARIFCYKTRQDTTKHDTREHRKLSTVNRFEERCFRSLFA